MKENTKWVTTLQIRFLLEISKANCRSLNASIVNQTVNQLGRIIPKPLWDVGDSNSRPHACEACALNQLS
jgi:hypothetical protein